MIRTSAILSIGRACRAFDPFRYVGYHKDLFPPSAGAGEDFASLCPDPKLIANREKGNDFKED